MPAFRSHDLARKFHCDVPGCSASFVKRAHLRRHEMTHTQQRDFTCPGCNRAFSRNDSMARHLRRKHPHLCRQSESSSTATTSGERLYTGVASGAADPFSSSGTVASTNGYSMLSLRSPYESAISTSSTQRGPGQQRLMSEPLERSSVLYNGYSRESVPRSPKSSNQAHWHTAASAREPNASLPSTLVQSADGPQDHQARFNYSLKEESGRGYLEHTASTNRPAWNQAPNAQEQSGQSSTSLFHWQPQSGQASHAPTGWSGTDTVASGPTTRSSDFDQRHDAQAGYFDPLYNSSALPSGLTSAAMTAEASSFSMRDDVLQSEFFVGPLSSQNEGHTFASHEPCIVPTQPTEQIRIESGAGPDAQLSNAAFLQPGPGLSGSDASPSARSTTAADTFFGVDFRTLSEHASAAAPPSADEVEQVMAGLGIHFGSSQASTTDVPPAFSLSTSFAQPLVPSQAHMVSAVPFHQNLHSQADSSQSSVFLPSLTASQTEYLGPHATSHRRTINRVFSSASHAFDTNSQTRGDIGSSQMAADEYDESLGRQAAAAMKLESQEDMAIDTSSSVPNFNKPHDLFPAQRAAWNDEGGRKSARREDVFLEGSTLTAVRRSISFNRREGVLHQSEVSSGAATHADVPPNTTSSNPPTTTTMGPPRQIQPSSASSNEQRHQSEMDVDEPISTTGAQQRPSFAITSTSPISGDQLQHVIDRFRVFAQLCQDHMHPSAGMLESLTPLLPKTIHADAPFFHPTMTGSQKAHSPEEVFALLSLVSLQSSDSTLQEEGHRLICFMWGLVLLSYRHTLHLGGKLQSFLNCFLLVGMHGLRQNSPDLWLNFEQNRESILCDVLKAVTRPSASDLDMDRIETDGLHGMAEEELFSLWSRWYEQESRKRTLLICAILDSQSSCYFSPLETELSARPVGPRCQFLFAHIHEPCPDSVFFAWPPKVWAARSATNVSLPSAKGAEIASQDGKLPSLASRLSELLFRPHLAHLCGKAARPRFRNSFDISAQSNGAPSTKTSQSSRNQTQDARTQVAGPFSEVNETSISSACSSRPCSQAGTHAAGSCRSNAQPEARTVSQLYMSALLEAVHGAWMTDSGWHQASEWGAAALSKRLSIDSEDFDVGRAGIKDLPGWRTGRTLDATQVAHALMNWSEMFSGRDDGCQTESCQDATSSGVKLTDDVHHLTIRWQVIFLGLCIPLQSICFYLNASRFSSNTDRERHRRISLLLARWVDSAYGRRALVHACTILTLLCAAKTRSQDEKLGPATSHAAFTSLAVLVCASKVLSQDQRGFESVDDAAGQAHEELVPIKSVQSSLLKFADHNAANSIQEKADDDDGQESSDSQEWLRVRFWHRRFQYLGLAGIFQGHEPGREHKPFADWRPSTSAGGTGATMSDSPLRGSFQRPRWSSFAGEAGSDGTRSTSRTRQEAEAARRRASYVHLPPHQPDENREDLRRQLLSSAAGLANPAVATRRWILRGATHTAKFCGLALWKANGTAMEEVGTSQDQSDSVGVLSNDHLRELVRWVRNARPAWCFSQEYTDLLLGAMGETQPNEAAEASANGNDVGCVV